MMMFQLPRRPEKMLSQMLLLRLERRHPHCLLLTSHSIHLTTMPSSPQAHL